MGKKVFSIVGLIGGILVLLMGVLVISGSFGGDTNKASTASYIYDTGYASFGADFYSYVSNNAAEAASAGRTTASNLDEIAHLLKNVCGIMTMAFGLFMMCFFGIRLSELKAKDTVIEAPKTAYTGPVTTEQPSQSKAVLTEKEDAEESESDVSETAEMETAE